MNDIVDDDVMMAAGHYKIGLIDSIKLSAIIYLIYCINCILITSFEDRSDAK